MDKWTLRRIDNTVTLFTTEYSFIFGYEKLGFTEVELLKAKTAKH